VAYDPSEVLLRDRIRGLIGDTRAVPVFPDVTYDAVIGLHTYPGHAIAEMAIRMARNLEMRATSMTATGDGSISWGANRAAALYALAKQYRQEADDQASGVGQMFTVYVDYLTGWDEGDVLDGSPA
jgi:hypothetical protein